MIVNLYKGDNANRLHSKVIDAIPYTFKTGYFGRLFYSLKFDSSMLTTVAVNTIIHSGKNLGLHRHRKKV